MAISRFFLPVRFIIGAGSLSLLGKEAGKLGKKALIVTGSKSMRRTGVLERVTTDLRESGVTATVFDRVEPNPRASTIDEGAKEARAKGIDLVIGLGGGSVMDAAKLIALASAGEDQVFAYYEGKVKGKPKALPIILVPTVAASGSEANNGAVFTNWDTHEKVVIMHPSTYPAVSIVDPELTLTLPAKTTAQGGVDIFCHLVESYITAHETTMINDAIRESSMRTVVESLPRVLAKPDDLQQRTNLSWASTIACSQFAGLGGGTGFMTLHGMEHPLSGEYDIAHGDGLASLLIAWMKFTAPVRESRFASLGENVFGSDDAITATENWLKAVGMHSNLANLGAREADCLKLAENAVRTAPWVKFHPRSLDNSAIAELYRQSFY
jgi:alcohol dehydrogenase class IV